ncbi:hypothetical protein L249_1177 [Ophiocordyceps polyrhachis-furcata BCC 54312]|uniref:Uncharacterized protein n=1 Tax=Ophiocordyceps polyrhachis-furcata BCC 54312 TaxID=1330021 RepID=A0A367LFL3_9HYPO|nr:hypothetical protein L249_1177 [Ophiocordyceps polyrhachis-furcata BCC 54312]
MFSNRPRPSTNDPVPPVNIPDPSQPYRLGISKVPNIPEIEGEYGVKICALNYDLASKVKQLVDSLPKLIGFASFPFRQPLLRSLAQSIAVLDAYLMLIPQDIIHKLAGKKIISAINARNYRERFTIISHRGLEKATHCVILSFQAHCSASSSRSDSSDRCDTLFPASPNGLNYCRNVKHLCSVKDENRMPPSPIILTQEEKDSFYDITNALYSNATLIRYIPSAFNILADLFSRLPLKAAPEKVTNSDDKSLVDIDKTLDRVRSSNNLAITMLRKDLLLPNLIPKKTLYSGKLRRRTDFRTSSPEISHRPTPNIGRTLLQFRSHPFKKEN